MGNRMRLWSLWFHPQIPYLILWIAAWVAGLFLPEQDSSPWIFLPFFLSLVAFGLPHGALDDTVFLHFKNQDQPSPQRKALFYLYYLGLIFLYLGFWFFYPVLSLLFFLSITWIHWGQGALHTLKTIYRIRYLDNLFLSAVSLVIRGGLPIFLTFLCYPETYLRVTQCTLQIFTSLPPLIASGILESLPFLFLFFLAILLIYILQVTLGQENLLKSGSLLDVGEILFLFGFFTTLHPLYSVGLYFCLWHSLRHLARLESWIPQQGPPDSRRFPGFPYATLRKSIPNTLLSLLGIIILYGVGTLATLTFSSLLGMYLVLISILTLPHLGVVIWMDFQESNFWKEKKQY